MLRCELHAHSSLSDGIDGVEVLLQEALRKGIDVISITDHDTLEGSFKALEIAEKENLPLLILPGYELSTKEGHLLIFGKENELEVLRKGIGIREAAEVFKGKNCLTALAHPYQFYRNGVPRPSRCINYVDAVEVFNARSILSFFNRMALSLARNHGKAFIAGSDSHSRESIGFGVTIVDAEPSIDSILYEIKSGNAKLNSQMLPIKTLIRESLKKRI
jgi:hypothetical protein